MTCVVTGGTGFVGRALIARLSAEGRPLRPIVRRPADAVHASSHVIDAPWSQADWGTALRGASAVVHLAARVHVMNEHAADPLAAFRDVNAAGTFRLARQAAEAGVRRFVFVSSIKVNGEHTVAGSPFRASDAPRPEDPYGISKREAEDGLRALAAASGMEVAIVRPPLVYGPGVKANFAALMRAVQRGLPLPFGAVTANRRSFVALDNLVDLLNTCIDHPAAANQTFLVSDGEDLSTADLLRRLGRAMNRPARLLPVPPALLRAGAALLGKRDMAQRLLGNLQLDITPTRETLGWTPPLSVDEGLRRAVAGLNTP